MTSILNRIISLNIELEGALRVAAARPSEEALESAKSKFAEISALFAMLDPSDFIAHKPDAQTELKFQEAEGGETEPLKEPDLPVVTAVDEEETAASAPIDDEDDYILGNEEDAPDEVIPMPKQPAALAPAVEEEAIAPSPKASEPKDDDEDYILGNEEDAPDEVIPMPGAHMLEARKPADLRKMFTLNDKFMFRRELFGNSDGEFNATLDLIAAMRTYEEAEEYAYEDLRWDRENPRVKEFMMVVQNFLS